MEKRYVYGKIEYVEHGGGAWKHKNQQIIEMALHVINMHMRMILKRQTTYTAYNNFDVMRIASYYKRRKGLWGNKEEIQLKMLRYIAVESNSVLFHVYSECSCRQKQLVTICIRHVFSFF